MNGIRFFGGVLYLVALITAAVKFGWQGAVLAVAAAAGCTLQNIKGGEAKDAEGEDRRSSDTD